MDFKIISSQRFLDYSIVASKIEAGDFKVKLSQIFEIDGERVCVLIDGTHAYFAAKESSNEIEVEFVETELNPCDDLDAFLVSQFNDSDWYYLHNNSMVF